MFSISSMWLPIGVTAFGALASAGQAKQQAQLAKEQYAFKSEQAANEARMAAINAGLAGDQLLYNQAKIEQQAMMQGLQAGQSIASSYVSQAGSGVALNSASKYELRASQRFAQAVNLANTEVNRVKQLTSDQMQIVGYKNQYIGKMAESRANSILSNAINGNEAFGSALALSAMQGVANLGMMMVGESLFGGVSLTGGDPNTQAIAQS